MSDVCSMPHLLLLVSTTPVQRMHVAGWVRWGSGQRAAYYCFDLPFEGAALGPAVRITAVLLAACAFIGLRLWHGGLLTAGWCSGIRIPEPNLACAV